MIFRGITMTTISLLATLLVGERTDLTTFQLIGLEMSTLCILWLIFVLPEGVKYEKE